MKLPIIRVEKMKLSKVEFYFSHWKHRCSGEGCNDGLICIAIWKTEYTLWTRKGMYCS